jgi:hypothetical protein
LAINVPVVGDFGRRVGDVGLGVLAVAVLGGAGFALKGPTPARSASPVALRTVVTPTPTASPTPTTAPTVTPAAPLLVLIGPDLAPLGDALATRTGDQVVALAGVQPAIITAAQLTQVEGTPQTVVVQVLAGATTTVRTRAALTALKARWPAAKLVFVGPLSSGDRKSAAAVKAAAVGDNVTFLDPVLLTWRTNDTSAVVTTRDRAELLAKLASGLA